MYTQDVMQELGVTRPVLQRLIDDGHIKPLNAVPPGGLAVRPRRLKFRAADVAALKANPPPRPSRKRPQQP